MPRESLHRRIADLEARAPAHAPQWVRILQYEGQTEEGAVAAYEAEHGPIDNKRVILRVIINKPFPAPVHA